MITARVLQGGIMNKVQAKEYSVELACAGMQFKPEAYKFWEENYHAKRDPYYQAEDVNPDKPEAPTGGAVKVRHQASTSTLYTTATYYIQCKQP